MKNQKSCVILNTASIKAIRPRPGNSMYSASKAATVNLTISLALELAEYGIRVVGINPVATATPMLKEFIGKDTEFNTGKEKYEASIPLGKVAKPEDIANAASFLVSNDAAMVTGSFIDVVDGGRGI
ncbi:NAD(P)-dependent dehydrogenase (short-subunit alcohol dehydrogenase family) [Virgibacillus halotolerans]|nr:NAD(P)-dependent dehydrogenase (short-subunit alcohol dehydrogenase family) [Virgibacillus halotolerans]